MPLDRPRWDATSWETHKKPDRKCHGEQAGDSDYPRVRVRRLWRAVLRAFLPFGLRGWLRPSHHSGRQRKDPGDENGESPTEIPHEARHTSLRLSQRRQTSHPGPPSHSREEGDVEVCDRTSERT